MLQWFSFASPLPARELAGTNRRYVTLDDPTARELANDDPALFMQRYPPPVLIDEIQYAPGLVPLVKIAIDQEQRPGDFWLTGSQQFHMMRGITETLADRVALVNLLGFSQREAQGAARRDEPFLPVAEKLTAAEPIEGAAIIWRSRWGSSEGWFEDIPGGADNSDECPGFTAVCLSLGPSSVQVAAGAMERDSTVTIRSCGLKGSRSYSPPRYSRLHVRQPLHT